MEDQQKNFSCWKFSYQKIFSSENFSENFLLENEKKLTKKEKNLWSENRMYEGDFYGRP